MKAVHQRLAAAMRGQLAELSVLSEPDTAVALDEALPEVGVAPFIDVTTRLAHLSEVRQKKLPSAACNAARARQHGSRSQAWV